jgi:hypothetical protein
LNREARTHLDRGVDYAAKGEGFYRKAAEEIVAAQQADPKLTQREIGEHFGRRTGWVQDLVSWHTSGSALPTPWTGEQEERGGRNMIGARKLLRDAPMEQVEQILAELPAERQQQVAAAAGHAYHKARVEYAEEERNLTPSQRYEREAAGETLTEPVRQAAAGFAVLGIVGHLEQARDEIHELISDGSLTPRLVRQIGRVLDGIEAEMQVARGLVGIEED